MVEPRHQPVGAIGRYSGVKELPLRNWDRNKARMDSIYQHPMRDFRQTAAQFGVPSSLADITTTEKGIPKMECTTTTKSDFCPPSLDRYIKVQGVCPERDYPSSSGLEYCPGRETTTKPQTQYPTSVPPMPRSKSTCPATMESLLPQVGPVPQLKYPPSVPLYPASRSGEFPATSVPYPSRVEAPKLDRYESPDYKPNVDYLSAKKGFKWPTPTEQPYTSHVEEREIPDYQSLQVKEDKTNEYIQEHTVNNKVDDYYKYSKDRGGAGDFNRPFVDYPVESEDHTEKRLLHDAMLERARREYEQNMGVPGSTVPLMTAGANPPDAIAHYNVPDYTQGSPAGGTIRARFGAPNRDMKMPITDPSYPKPEYKIPPPEAGLTKTSYSVALEGDRGNAGVTHTPPVRYPDKIYNTARHVEPNEVETPSHAGSGAAERYIPSIIEAQDKLLSTHTKPMIQPSEGRTECAQPLDESPTETPSENPKVEPLSLKGLRRIQTSNQVYGSWIDDPYLKDNDWWFKARPKNPRTKTYLSLYKEENAWQ
uniref:Uncharacterized protein n=1 Tax=Lygus hesperus TaxID=30085 RepID=A0A0A9YJG2_LYGHE